MSVATDVLQRRPQAVAMVGLGPSANAFWLEAARWDAMLPWDEVWVVNRAAMAFKHDLAWNMHDLRDLTRNAKAPAERLRLLESTIPVMTVRAYPEFPMAVEYPLKAVMAYIKHDVLSSTPAHMVAYAMMIGVKTIYLYGMDFHYQNLPQAERGGQGMAFLLGVCTALGIDYKIPNTSSLLAANECVLVTHAGGGPQSILRPIYGYTWDGVNGPRDPRVGDGDKVEPGDRQMPVEMSVNNTGHYRLGEAELGDLSPDGSKPLTESATPAVTEELRS